MQTPIVSSNYGSLINSGALINSVVFAKKNINSYASNSTIDYILPLFNSSIIVGNIPAVSFTDYNQFITLNLSMTENFQLKDYNYLSITPYIYQYNGQTAFASTDDTVSLFDIISKGNLSPFENNFNFVFTFSENIANYYSAQGYIVCKIPSDIPLSDFTFTFLLRIGTELSIPTNKISRSTLKLNTINNFNLGKLYTSYDILLKTKPQFNSYFFYINRNYLSYLLTYYNNTINYYQNNTQNYTQITTYPYMANFTNSNTAITNIYESIQYSPPINLEGNNTGENYFNTNPIILSNYLGCNIIIVSVNQNAFGFGLTSNIQIYNITTFNLISDGSYDTSPTLPEIGSINYPKTNLINITTGQNMLYLLSYPLINTKILSVSDIISANPGITGISIGERVSYNPINYNCSNYNNVPKFAIFIAGLGRRPLVLNAGLGFPTE